MVRFFIAAASLLSLLSFSRAATIDVRQCKYTCPSDPNYTTNVDSSLAPNDITICRYIDAHGNTVRECQYNIITGTLVSGNPAGACAGTAKLQC